MFSSQFVSHTREFAEVCLIILFYFSICKQCFLVLVLLFLTILCVVNDNKKKTFCTEKKKNKFAVDENYNKLVALQEPGFSYLYFFIVIIRLMVGRHSVFNYRHNCVFLEFFFDLFQWKCSTLKKKFFFTGIRFV